MQKKKRGFFVNFIKIDANKALISSIIFIFLVTIFFTASSVMLFYCEQINSGTLENCVAYYGEFNGNYSTFAILISYYFIVFSFPIISILPILGSGLSPFAMWITAIITNFVYVYFISCLIVFIYEHITTVPKKTKKKKEIKNP